MSSNGNGQIVPTLGYSVEEAADDFIAAMADRSVLECDGHCTNATAMLLALVGDTGPGLAALARYGGRRLVEEIAAASRAEERRAKIEALVEEFVRTLRAR
jgi:hypothetical protein